MSDIDINKVRADIAKDMLARMEEEEFLDICNDLMMSTLR